MDRKDAEQIVTAYKAIVEKACAILGSNGPPWGYISEGRFAHITFDGDDVVVIEPKSDYDSTSIESEEIRFPAILLFMDDAELKAWKTQAKAEYDAAQKAVRENRRHAAENAERATLASLQAKYGKS